MMCPICKNSNNNPQYNTKEMMFGLRHPFTYEECASCGCVYLLHTPVNMNIYYPKEYYSLVEKDPWSGNFLTQWIKQKRARSSAGDKTLIGKIFVKLLGVPPVFTFLKSANVSKNSKILDVGCGNGHTLFELSLAGFTNLFGVDPYLEFPKIKKHGVYIEKKGLSDVKSSFDCILLNHVFEHLNNPLETLQLIKKHLLPNGTAVIRIPIGASHAWQTYRGDWVQLDSPRHLFLHTPKSIRLLVEQAGLKIKKTVYDSSAFQFWGSEQNRQNIPLMSKQSYLKGNKSLFTKEQISMYNTEAEKLNKEEKGDQATFYIINN